MDPGRDSTWQEGVSSTISSLAKKRASIAWLDGDVHEYAGVRGSRGWERNGERQGPSANRIKTRGLLIDRIKQLGDR